MKLTSLLQWVRSKSKWIVTALVAIGVVVGEIETGVGEKLLEQAKEAWEMPDMNTSASAVLAAVNSSVSIRLPGVPAPYGNGSGTMVNRFGHTYVLTAAHVVQVALEAVTNDLDRAYVTVYKGTNKWEAYVINCDRHQDLALLRIVGTNVPGVSIKFFNPRLIPPIGTKLLHVGNLLGQYPRSYSEGVLAGLGGPAPEDPHNEYDQTTVTDYPGSSGGGVFTADGRYAGMILQWDGPGINFICPVRRMVEWADQNDLLWLFY